MMRKAPISRMNSGSVITTAAARSRGVHPYLGPRQKMPSKDDLSVAADMLRKPSRRFGCPEPQQGHEHVPVEPAQEMIASARS